MYRLSVIFSILLLFLWLHGTTRTHSLIHTTHTLTRTHRRERDLSCCSCEPLSGFWMQQSSHMSTGAPELPQHDSMPHTLVVVSILIGIKY